eukprot:14807062-Alexandrium_andersonii.AAC.1
MYGRNPSGTHPAGWFSHKLAPLVRTHRPSTRARRHRDSHAESLHAPSPALDLRPRHQVLRAALAPGARGHR